MTQQTKNKITFSLFKVWFGFGAPLYFFGALVLSFWISPWLSLFLFLSYVWRFYDSFTKTCCRCPNYGTFRCGFQGKMASWFVKRKIDSLSPSQILNHSYIDWGFILAAWLIYWQIPWLAMIALIWPLGAYFICYRPKQFHGLLHKL